MFADAPPIEHLALADRCDQRCHRRASRRFMRRTVRAYGIPLLRARVACESADVGGYRLQTTGNGYWFAHQFNVTAWRAAGGHVTGGVPVGKWTTHPGRLEQDYRAVVLDRISLGDPWPNCP